MQQAHAATSARWRTHASTENARSGTRSRKLLASRPDSQRAMPHSRGLHSTAGAMKCSRLQNASLQLQVRLMQVLMLILWQQPLLRKPPAQVLLDPQELLDPLEAQVQQELLDLPDLPAQPVVQELQEAQVPLA